MRRQRRAAGHQPQSSRGGRATCGAIRDSPAPTGSQGRGTPSYYGGCCSAMLAIVLGFSAVMAAAATDTAGEEYLAAKAKQEDVHKTPSGLM